MPNPIKSTLDAKIKKKMEESLLSDIKEFAALSAKVLPDDDVTESGNYVFLMGEPDTDERIRELYDAPDGQVNILTVDQESTDKLQGFKDGVDVGEIKERFESFVSDTKSVVDDYIHPGDDKVRDVVYAMTVNPARDAIRGWSMNKAGMRVAFASQMPALRSVISPAMDMNLRERVRVLDESYPVNRLLVESDRALRAHYDYFDALDGGTLTAQRDIEIRHNLLSDEERMLEALDRMETVIPGTPEAEEIDKNLVKKVSQNRRFCSSGTGKLYSDTKARITGLRNGWPIEDLNALACLRIRRDQIYGRVFYDPATGERRQVPSYAEGEREYLRKLDRLWSRINDTVIRTNEERLELLTGVRDILREGIDNRLIPVQAGQVSYDLYTLDRIIARELSPAESEVMQGNLNDQMVAQYDSERQAEADQARQQRIHDELEERERLEDIAAGEALAMGLFDEEREPVIVDEEEQRAAAERERLRLDSRSGARRWHFDELDKEYAAAEKAVGLVRRGTSVFNDMLRYHMGSKDITFDQALDMNLDTDEAKKSAAGEYFNAMAEHPFRGDLPVETIEANAAWHGKNDARAIRNILRKPFPHVDPRDREQLKGLAECTSPAGRVANFLMDFNQDIEGIVPKNRSDSMTRHIYMEAFGGRIEYAQLQGRVLLATNLSELASIATKEAMPPHVQALAVTYLERILGRIRNTPLDQVDPTLWNYTRAVATVVQSAASEEGKLPLEGAPDYARIRAYLDGRGGSPFTEAYLQNIEERVRRQRMDDPVKEVAAQWREYSSGRIDLSRVYNLDFISLRDQTQTVPDIAQLRAFNDGKKREINRVFEHCFGNLITLNTMQADLSCEAGLDPMDRFAINGVRMSELISQNYPKDLSKQEKELAMETELLCALADNTKSIEFHPLNYDMEGHIVENGVKAIPHARPQREAAAQQAAPDEGGRFRTEVEAVKTSALQLDSFVPGLFRVYSPDHLPGRLERGSAAAGALDPERQVRREYLRELIDRNTALEKALRAQGRGAQADFVRFKNAVTSSVLQRDGAAAILPLEMLSGLANSIKLKAGDVPTVQEVFDILTDAPGDENPFPVAEVGSTAAKLQQGLLDAASKDGATMQNEGQQDRTALLETIDELSSGVRQMRRAVGGLNRKEQLDRVFGEGEVDRFVNGTPGAKTILADLEGRKTAILKGWPIADNDLIASFYSRRQVLKAAADGFTSGSADRLRYERAFRAVDEICRHIEENPVHNAQERDGVLQFIHSYGNALYNDTVACAGMADRGQLGELTAAMTGAMGRQAAPEAFPTAEQTLALIAIRPAAEEARDEDIEYRSDAPAAAEAPAEANAQIEGAAEEEAVDEAQEEADSLVSLFDRDGEFYALGSNPTEEDMVRRAQESREARRTAAIVPGFFDLSETMDRVKRLNADKVPGLLKESPTRLMNDLRAYYLGKGECTYTERVEEMGANGERIFRDVARRVPVENFEQAMDLSLLPMSARQQLVEEFLKDLEYHPFGPGVDDATARENARYYAGLHREAMRRFQHPGYAGIDMNDPSDIRRFAQGGSVMSMKAAFSQDFSQNTEIFSVVRPADEKDAPNRLRSAYIEAFGGPENYAEFRDRQDVFQGMCLLARIASGRENGPYSLMQRALAKHYLSKFNDELISMKDINPELHRMGMGLEATAVSSYLTAPENVGNAQGAPGDEALRDYLEGRTPSPFDEAYIADFDSRMLQDRIASFERERTRYAQALENGFFDTARVYNLSYIPMPVQTVDGAGNRRYAPMKAPDYYSFTPEQLEETERMYDQTLGTLTGLSTYGLQSYYAAMQEEAVIDRLRINGMKAMDYLKANGFASIDADLPAENHETIKKAALLAALADHDTSVTFVPYAMNESGELVDGAPITIARGPLKTPPERELTMKGPSVPDLEGENCFVGLNDFVTGSGAITAVSPDEDLFDGIEDADIREMVKGKDASTGVDDFLKNTFRSAGDEPEPGEMDITGRNYYPYSGKKFKYPYAAVIGTREDGTLTDEGKKNLENVKTLMKNLKAKVEGIADGIEKKNPYLADYIRMISDDLRTAEDGGSMLELFENSIYQIVCVQNSSFNAPPYVDASSPAFMDEEFKAYLGYPAGEVSFKLPQAIEAARRLTLSAADHGRLQSEGILTKRADRTMRNMLLSELDELEKDLRSIDDLDTKSMIDGSPEDEFRKMLTKGSAGGRSYLCNSIHEVSSHFPRGTREVWWEMEARRSLLANGWPIEDLNLLSLLYTGREKMRIRAAKTEKGAVWCNDMARTEKVLDQIIGEIEKNPIRNEQDRLRILRYIDSYGDNFYNGNFLTSEDAGIPMLKSKMKKALERQVLPDEFLNEQELESAKAAYQAYLARKGSADPDALTVNGPTDPAERAFINPTRIMNMTLMYERLGRDAGFTARPEHRQLLSGIDSFLTAVDAYYANTDLMRPENAQAKRAAFDSMFRQAESLSAQINRSINIITDNGRIEDLSRDQMGRLEALRQIQDQMRHMRNTHTAYVDFEIRRKNDLAQMLSEQEMRERRSEQFSRELYENLVATDSEGNVFADKDFIMDRMSPEDRRRLSDLYEGNVPNAVPVEYERGVLKPSRLVEADKEAAIRERERRLQRSNERQQEDAYAEGAAQLFENAAADRRFETTRRMMQASESGDERYAWSFEHILQDAFDKKEAALSEYNETLNDLGPDRVETISAAGIRSAEAGERYSGMMNQVAVSFDTEMLRSAMAEKWPEWYNANVAPKLERMDPAKVNIQIFKLAQAAIPEKELHAFIGELAKTQLREDQSDDMRRRLLSFRLPAELPFEEQVTHPLHDRIAELKGQLRLDENGIPYPPDSREAREYQEALDYSDRFVTESDELVRRGYFVRRDMEEAAYHNVRNNVLKSYLESPGEEDLKVVANDLFKNAADFVAKGVLPEQEEARDRIVTEPFGFSAGYIDSVTGLLSMMEEMDMPMSDDFPGGTGEQRGFSDLCAAKEALSIAVLEGNAQEIVAAKKVYEQKRADIDRLWDYVKDENHFAKYSIPGNIDSTRQSLIPLEYSSDYYTNSKINSMYMLYSGLKWAQVSIQDFRNDPTAAIEKIRKKASEEVDFDLTMRGKSPGEILGALAGETKNDAAVKMNRAVGMIGVIARITEGIVVMDPDVQERSRNQVFDELKNRYHTNLAEQRAVQSNPYGDDARKAQVEQLMSIVSEEDLRANRTAMLSAHPFDSLGRNINAVTPADYVAGLGPNYRGYSALVSRGEDMIIDAMRTGKGRFDPVSFMENRQKALSLLLTARARDAGVEGFALLQDEVVHAAQYYDSIRRANPELNMPALTKAQVKAFDRMGETFKQQMKQATRNLTDAQKQTIAGRNASIQGMQAADQMRIEQVRNLIYTQERRFVERFNEIEEQRIAQPGLAGAHADERYELLRDHRQWFIDAAARGDVPVMYASKRIEELSRLENGGVAQMPGYEALPTSRPKNHAQRVAEFMREGEVCRRIVYDNDTLSRKLRLSEFEDPVALRDRRRQQDIQLAVERNRIQQEAYREINERAQREAAMNAERERENIRREAALTAAMGTPLSLRLMQRFDELAGAELSEAALAGQAEVDPEVCFAARQQSADASRRLNAFMTFIKDRYSPDDLQAMLGTSLGTRRGAALFDKLGRRTPTAMALKSLTQEERQQLFGAIAGDLEPRVKEEWLAADDAFKPEAKYDFSSQVTGTSGTVWLEFNSQVARPDHERVEELLKDAGVNWQSMSGGAGKEELEAFRRDLFDADDMLYEVKEEVGDLADSLRVHDAERINNVATKMHREGLQKPENAYLHDLFENRNGIKVTKQERQEDVKRALLANPAFAPGYIKGVADILRKMDENRMLTANTGAEQAVKVYAFQEVIDAKRTLKEALRADMTSGENRRALSAAVAGFKEAESRMDELFGMAKQTFSATDYEDNLDVVRNRNVPWQYARDRVTASQLNAVWMFGNLLKESGISFDEFEQHPDEAIQRLKLDSIRKSASLTELTKNQSFGQIAAYGACNYYTGQFLANNSVYAGQYTRGICGLIDSAPEDGNGVKAQNRFLYMENMNGYVDSLGSVAMANSKCLSDGFRGRSNEGIKALQTLSVIPEEDFDAERMLTTVPMAADGTRKEPFSLGDYLAGKENFDYQAQTGRLEQMLRDAAQTHEQIKLEKKTPLEHRGVNGPGFDVNGYDPFPLLQARQKALTQLLTLRAPGNMDRQGRANLNDSGKPGFAQLEEELLHTARHYENLRTAHPELNLPELTKEQKKTLERQAELYKELKTNRKKLINKQEENLYKAVKRDEKTFNTQMAQLGESIAKLDERIGRRNAKIQRANEKLHLANQRGDEAAGLAAFEEKSALTREREALRLEKERLNRQREALKISRVRSLTNGYKSGQLPESYVEQRLEQIRSGHFDAQLPKLFGDSPAQLDARESFFTARLMNKNGSDITVVKTALTQSMTNTMQQLGMELEDGFVILEQPQAQAPQAQAPQAQAPQAPQAQAPQAQAPQAQPQQAPQDAVNRISLQNLADMEGVRMNDNHEANHHRRNSAPNLNSGNMHMGS